MVDAKNVRRIGLSADTRANEFEWDCGACGLRDDRVDDFMGRAVRNAQVSAYRLVYSGAQATGGRMTPDQFEHAAEECTKVLEEFALFTKKDNRSKEALGFLKEIIALAKAAIPSGQVAEDARAVASVLERAVVTPSVASALQRLAAQAQSAHEWFAKWEQAATLVGQLRKERDGLERQRDARERDLLVHFEAKNAALKRVEELEAQCARLSAAGQVLSEHVDKQQCPCLTDALLGTERPCPEHDATWTLRDEFAMVAMHTVVTVCKAEIDDGRLSFRDIARRAYGMADEMLRAREAK